MKVDEADLTLDRMLNGRLLIRQYRNGYRFSIDAPILAWHARPKPGERLLELGSGCGVVILILACRFRQVTLIGVEIQQQLARLSQLNAAVNGLSERVTTLHMDLKTLGLAHLNKPVDWVVCNPPYYPAEAGRLNPNPQRAMARHEIGATLNDVVDAAARCLKTGGRLVLMHAADRIADLVETMRSCHIEPKFMRLVHGRLDAAAKMVLIKGAKRVNTGLKVGPPLVLYDRAHAYTAEVQAMLR